LKIYKITDVFPKEEKFGLVSQIRRIVVSLVSNIVEDYGRKTTAEHIRSLYTAYGSICELKTQIPLSGDLGYIVSFRFGELKERIQEVKSMLKALIESL
jgi:four helix bundle protein